MYYIIDIVVICRTQILLEKLIPFNHIAILYFYNTSSAFPRMAKTVLKLPRPSTKKMLSCLMFYIIATKWEEYLRGHLNAADNNSSSPPPLNSVCCSSSKVFLWFYMCAFTLLICTVCLVPLLFMSKCTFKGNIDLFLTQRFFSFLT